MDKIFDIWWGFTAIACGVIYANVQNCCLIRMMNERQRDTA